MKHWKRKWKLLFRVWGLGEFVSVFKWVGGSGVYRVGLKIQTSEPVVNKFSAAARLMTTPIRT